MEYRRVLTAWGTALGNAIPLDSVAAYVRGLLTRRTCSPLYWFAGILAERRGIPTASPGSAGISEIKGRRGGRNPRSLWRR